MRRIRWILSLGAFFLWIPLASSGEISGPPCGCNPHANCYAVSGSSLSPGCCEPRRHCYDNAWDGYCQERARWDAFWYKVGTGAFRSCPPSTMCGGCGAVRESRVYPAAGAYGCQPSAVELAPASVNPAPAAPLPPAPVARP